MLADSPQRSPGTGTALSWQESPHPGSHAPPGNRLHAMMGLYRARPDNTEGPSSFTAPRGGWLSPLPCPAAFPSLPDVMALRSLPDETSAC